MRIGDVLGRVDRLEEFWHNLVLTVPLAKDVNGAIVACYPALPIFACNHAADINVNEDEAENLLERVTEYFLSRGSPFVCFRISPLTHPRTFSFFLESRGFEKKGEESVMVFHGKQIEEKLNLDIKVKEISETEIDIFNKLLLTIFEMPFEWKSGLDKLIHEWMRIGAKHYLAYVEEKPVGITTLLSLQKIGGIFNIGTVKEYRGRGIGTTLTAYAILDSIKEGNNIHTLQAEKGGGAERLYRNIGFEIDHTVSFFVKNFQARS